MCCSGRTVGRTPGPPLLNLAGSTTQLLIAISSPDLVFTPHRWDRAFVNAMSPSAKAGKQTPKEWAQLPIFAAGLYFSFGNLPSKHWQSKSQIIFWNLTRYGTSLRAHHRGCQITYQPTPRNITLTQWASTYHIPKSLLLFSIQCRAASNFCGELPVIFCSKESIRRLVLHSFEIPNNIISLQ